MLGVPAAAGEVVDDRDLVAARREAHRGRPAEVPVTAQDQDPHEPREGSRTGSPLASCAASVQRPAVLARPMPSPTLPPELTAIRAVGLVLAAADRRLRDRRRRELRNADVLDPAARRARPRDRRRHRDPRRAALGVLVRARERHPDRRRRDLRDPDPLPARPARAQPGLADHQRALGGARGARLGAVSRRRQPRALSRQDRRARPRLQRGRQRRRRCSTGSRPRSAAWRPRCSSSTTARATAPTRSPGRTARSSPAT